MPEPYLAFQALYTGYLENANNGSYRFVSKSKTAFRPVAIGWPVHTPSSVAHLLGLKRLTLSARRRLNQL
jgi:hypothetical protein